MATGAPSRETSSSSEESLAGSERAKLRKVGSEEESTKKKEAVGKEKKKRDPLCVFDDCYSDCESDFKSREDFLEYHRYLKEVEENGPFGLTFHLSLAIEGAVYKFDEGRIEADNTLKACTQFAIQENKPDLVLLKITYAARTLIVGFHYFIKFEAKDPSFPEQVKTYRTRVEQGFNKEFAVILFQDDDKPQKKGHTLRG
ncbi:hypothetical protein Tsubulata_034394 [Turnera subulata]|uniref:Cystatin domain-containing protein n=1 Tax=Turnera subulata TaxID=218843 RepID=A0A9Q0F2G8_9ROSI|nr:hypothetical protein Tsubulata_034394 [Turnera subulata]